MAIAALDIALTQVFNTIPPEILNLAFMGPSRFMTQAVPQQQLIVEKVIQARVLKDCNLMGGKSKMIPLLSSYIEDIPTGYTDRIIGVSASCVYRIPKEEREFVPITEVAGCYYPGYIRAGTGTHPNNPGINLMNIAQGVLQSHTFPNNPPTPIPELLAGDLVRLNPPQSYHVEWILTCRLGYDPQLSNLNTSAIKPFANLVEYAVKAYIYNTMLIKIDTAFIQGGQELGSVLRVIETYSEAEQRYTELLDQFSGSTKLDVQTLSTILRYAI
jgi:hypothetical protein